MLRALPRLIPLLAALTSACGPAPAPAAAPASVSASAPEYAPASAPAPAAAAAPDPAVARKAAEVALTALSRRSFDVEGCDAAAARVLPEAEARAGVPAGERCAVLVARTPDETWLVVVRSTLASKSVGAQARVIVTSGAEGVRGIEYDK